MQSSKIHLKELLVCQQLFPWSLVQAFLCSLVLVSIGIPFYWYFKKVKSLVDLR
ncbi:MAG: hypothetical protein M3352_08930 [Bacteroidota bacterium]|nr:hypothetical protein [Bacteroidota bacterium]